MNELIYLLLAIILVIQAVLWVRVGKIRNNDDFAVYTEVMKKLLGMVHQENRNSVFGSGINPIILNTKLLYGMDLETIVELGLGELVQPDQFRTTPEKVRALPKLNLSYCTPAFVIQELITKANQNREAERDLVAMAVLYRCPLPADLIGHYIEDEILLKGLLRYMLEIESVRFEEHKTLLKTAEGKGVFVPDITHSEWLQFDSAIKTISQMYSKGIDQGFFLPVEAVYQELVYNFQSTLSMDQLRVFASVYAAMHDRPMPASWLMTKDETKDPEAIQTYVSYFIRYHQYLQSSTALALQ